MEVYQQAIARFEETFARAKNSSCTEPTAVNLATVGADGRPASRFVLLKAFDERGFVFFTNFNSRKGRALLHNRHAALCFFWEAMMEQVRIEGIARPVSDADADAYWVTRHRASQIGAWASQQSEDLDKRETLEARIASVEAQYAGKDIPRPQHWSGFRVEPERIEFWVGVDFRLHERTIYCKQGDEWTVGLLNP